MKKFTLKKRIGKMRYLIVITAISFLLMSCDQLLRNQFKDDIVLNEEDTTEYASISGWLTDNVTSAAISGATVTAYYDRTVKTAKSDSSGFWYMNDIPYGRDMDSPDTLHTVMVVVSAPGYVGGSQSAELFSVNTWALGALALKWGSSVLHQVALGTGNFPQTDTVANERYYMADNTSNVDIYFNMPVDTLYSDNNTLIEMFDSTGTSVAFSGSWNSGKTTYSIDPTSTLTCDSVGQGNTPGTYHRIRLVNEVRSYTEANIIKHINDGAYIDFRVICGTFGSLLASSTPSLVPSADSGSSYQFDSMGVDVLNAGGDVISAASGNTDIWLAWSVVSGAASYKVYYINTGLGAATGSVWLDTGVSPTIDETGSTVLVQINPVYNGNYMGDSKMTGGESVKFVVTAINSDGMESAIGSTTPLTITDAKGPSLVSVTVSNPSAANSEYNSATVLRSLTLTFNEPMKTSLGDDNVTLTKSGNNISSISETGVWGYTNTNNWSDSDLGVTFAVPSTTLSEAVYSSSTLLKVASASTFLVGDVIGIMDNAVIPVRVNGTIADVNSGDNILTVSAMAPSTNYTFASGASVLLVDRAGLTVYRTTTAANAQQGLTALTVASAANFFAGQTLTIVNLDDDGTFDNTDTTSVTISSISSTTFTLSAALARDIPSGSLVIDGSATFAEAAPRNALDYTGTRTEEVIFDTSTASTTIRSTGEYADSQSTVILVTDETGFGVDDFIKIAASSASTTLNGSDNDSDTSLTVASTADFREGDIVIIHGEVISLTVTDDGGSGDNHTLRNATLWANGGGSGVNDNFSFSSGQQIFNGDAITLTDAAVTTTLAANVDRSATTMSISLTSTAGLAEGQDLIINDGSEAADTVTISLIVSASAVTVTDILADTTEPYLAGAKVTRAVVTDTCNVDAASSSTTIVMCDDQPEAFSDAMTATVKRAFEKETVSGVASSTVLTITAPSDPHPTGTSVTLLSFPETRKITAVATYSLTLDSALVYPHHGGAAVTKAATAEVEFGAGEMDTVLVGDIVIVDKDGSATTVLDRIDATVASINTGKATVVLTPVTSTTSIVTIDGDNASFSFMGDAVKVTGAQDSSGNAQQTGYARYANMGSASNGVDL